MVAVQHWRPSLGGPAVAAQPWRPGHGDASRADQGRRKTGNRRMTRARWPAPGVAGGHLGRGPITTTLAVAAEAGAPRRSEDEGAAVAMSAGPTKGAVRLAIAA